MVGQKSFCPSQGEAGTAGQPTLVIPYFPPLPPNPTPLERPACPGVFWGPGRGGAHPLHSLVGGKPRPATRGRLPALDRCRLQRGKYGTGRTDCKWWSTCGAVALSGGVRLEWGRGGRGRAQPCCFVAGESELQGQRGAGCCFWRDPCSCHAKAVVGGPAGLGDAANGAAAPPHAHPTPHARHCPLFCRPPADCWLRHSVQRPDAGQRAWRGAPRVILQAAPGPANDFRLAGRPAAVGPRGIAGGFGLFAGPCRHRPFASSLLPPDS